MGFFGSFWAWLGQQLATYIGTNTARLAQVLEPAFVTFTTLYVMAWGYLQLAGRLEEPATAALKRIALIALVIGAGLRLWLYNSVIVDTFYTAPARLAAAVVGADDPVGTIDAIWERGGAVAGHLWDKSSLWPSGFGFTLAAAVLWCLLGLLCVYTMFLIALSNIALAVLLALGPLFIGLALFPATRRLFVAWIGQLTTYALVTVLTVLVAALLLQIMESYATQTLALGSAVTTVDALNLMLMAALVFLLLRQIMPIAAALGGGVSLQSLGAVSRSLRWGVGTGGRSAGWTMRHGVVLAALVRERRRMRKEAALASGRDTGSTGEGA